MSANKAGRVIASYRREHRRQRNEETEAWANLCLAEGWGCQVCGWVPERGQHRQVAQSRVGGRAGTTGLTLAARSCSVLKVDPHVPHRHPVIAVRVASAAIIREGLKDKASSPPHWKHKRSNKRPLFWAYQYTRAVFVIMPASGKDGRQRRGLPAPPRPQSHW